MSFLINDFGSFCVFDFKIQEKWHKLLKIILKMEHAKKEKNAKKGCKKGMQKRQRDVFPNFFLEGAKKYRKV